MSNSTRMYEYAVYGRASNRSRISMNGTARQRKPKRKSFSFQQWLHLRVVCFLILKGSWFFVAPLFVCLSHFFSQYAVAFHFDWYIFAVSVPSLLFSFVLVLVCRQWKYAKNKRKNWIKRRTTSLTRQINMVIACQMEWQHTKYRKNANRHSGKQINFRFKSLASISVALSSEPKSWRKRIIRYLKKAFVFSHGQRRRLHHLICLRFWCVRLYQIGIMAVLYVPACSSVQAQLVIFVFDSAILSLIRLTKFLSAFKWKRTLETCQPNVSSVAPL